MANILVPDYLGQHVLAGIRSLARKGDVVAWAWKGARAKRKKSRFIAERHSIVPSTEDRAAYARSVADLCAQREFDCVIPFGLTSCHALCSLAQGWGLPLLLPSFSTFEKANDKLRTLAECRRLGVPTPLCLAECRPDDLRGFAAEARFPVVVKARSGQGVNRTIRYANNAEELLRAYEEVASTAQSTSALEGNEPMVQEFVPGPIHDACTLSFRGEVVNVLTQVRRIMWPIQGGVGAVNVTTNDERLRRLAITVLEGLQWNGPAQIEFKLDRRDNAFKLIEMNPKFWGTLDLAIKAGMDFPWQLRNLVLGRPVERMQKYEVGLRYKFWFPQASEAYWQLVRTFGWRAVRDRTSYTKECCDIDWSDPIPDLKRAFRSVRKLIRRGPESLHSNLAPELISFNGTEGGAISTTRS